METLRGNRFRIQYQLVIMALALVFSGCGRFVMEDADALEAMYLSGGGVKASSTVEAFAQTLFPLLRSKCSSCHGTNQGPIFAVANAADALSVMNQASLYDFRAPSNSKIVRKSSDSHCGAGCAGNAEQFTSEIQKWSALVANVPSGGGGGGVNPSPSSTPTVTPGQLPTIFTGNFILPANLSASNPTTVTYPLNTISANFNGANLLVDVVRLSAATNAYILRNLRITIPAGSAMSIYIEGIYARMNNTVEANATTWSELGAIVSAATSGRQLSQSVMVVSGVNGPGQDQLSIALRLIQVANPNCSNTAANSPFVTQVRPILINKCANCHGNQGVFRINNGDTNVDLCNRVLQRVDLVTPLQSALILLPQTGVDTRGGGAHPATNLYNQNEINQIVNWIKLEDAAR